MVTILFKQRFLISVIIIILISIFFFRGSVQYGMEFDEVFRINNIIPYINSNAEPYNQSISNFNFFGSKIPLMYKEYISSIFMIQYVPLVIFDDYLLGIRFLEWFYFVASIIGMFWIMAKHNFRYALIVSLLVITSPILYPDIRYGFISTVHFFLITLAVHLLYKFFNTNRKSVILYFFSIFIFFLTINFNFYTIWLVTGLAIASLFFYSKYWGYCFKSLKLIVLTIVASLLGLFNFFYYNFTTGIATLRPLYYKLFSQNKYNENPIDYKIQSTPLLEEVIGKIKIVINFFGTYSYIYILIFALMLLFYLVSLINLVYSHNYKKIRYFFPLVALLITSLLIFISPNTVRAEHYSYLIPLIEVSGIILLIKIIDISKIKKYIVIIPILILIINFLTVNIKVTEANNTKGTGIFSSSIFALNNYINDQNIDFDDVVHLQWGMYSQLYFLNKGEVRINSLVFQMLGAKDELEKAHILTNYILSLSHKNEQLYFPIYSSIDPTINSFIENFFNSIGGKLIIKNKFYEHSGKESILLYELVNLKEIKENLSKDLLSAEVSKELKILDFGPKNELVNQDDDLGMWFKTTNHSPSTKIVLNNSVLETVYYEDHLTALVPKNMIHNSQRFEFYLYDSLRKIRSDAEIIEKSHE